MKVTVELTDEQANDICLQGSGPYIATTPYGHAIKVIAAAIVAARPKPLKVGDKVTTLGSALVKEVVAIGVDPCNGRRWMVVADEGSSSPFLWIEFQAVQMADGSPIVWPE